MCGLILGCACPTSCLKATLFCHLWMFIYFACSQKARVIHRIILSQDGRTSFEGRTLQEGELLLEDMVSG